MGKSLVGRRAGVFATVLGLVLLVLVSATSPAEARGGSLTVRPGSGYVGGQLVTFSGDVGPAGKRSIHLQFSMSGGASWVDVPRSGSSTRSDGSFSFRFPAPSMFGIKMRVVGKGVATPAWTFDARSQEVVIGAASAPGVLGDQVLAGTPLTITVDTAPIVKHHTDLPPPVFVGRGLTLQVRRSDGTWQSTGATTKTDSRGLGRFLVTAPASTGPVTYRVREENWTAGGNRIGWFPSFPMTLHVVDVLPRAGGPAARVASTAPAGPAAPATVPAATVTERTAAARATAAVSAAKAFGWGNSQWDFAWEYGESLTSPPARGLNPRGWWQDGSTGSGRAAKHNGGLTLDSQPAWSGPGDRGDTWATMRGNPAAYGRWEVRFRVRRFETGAKDYHAKVELVPDRAADQRCGTRDITVADVPVYGSSVGFGVKSSGGRQWSATRGISIGSAAVTFAVEVNKDHITWYYNAKPIGTVRSTAAVSDVPLTMKLSLLGPEDTEMNHTQLISDWQRGWSLLRGKQVKNAPALTSSTYDATCTG